VYRWLGSGLPSARPEGFPEFIPSTPRITPRRHLCDESPALTAVLQAHASNSTEGHEYSHRLLRLLAADSSHGRSFEQPVRHLWLPSARTAAFVLLARMQESTHESSPSELRQAAPASPKQQIPTGPHDGRQVHAMWLRAEFRCDGVPPSKPRKQVVSARRANASQPTMVRYRNRGSQM